MLTQEAASYVYKGTGATAALLSVGIQTWKSDWQNYRVYQDGATRYREATDAEVNTPVWRQHESYGWNSPHLNPDGSYKNFVDFNWSQQPLSAQPKGWLKAGEIIRYNHYSQILETKNANGLYAAQKEGHQHSRLLAQALNARYTEMAYSGAEDQVVTTGAPHFGGEVQDGRRDNTRAHTGLYSVKLASGETGFTYRALVGNANEVSTDRMYRLSAWVHRSDAGVGNGRLYAKIGSTQLGETSLTAATTKKAGDWYLLNLYVTIPNSASGQELTVGCRNAGSSTTPVHFDDFRFHPVDAPLVATVYDPHTGQVTNTLDNDNFYTRYEYDNAGKLKRVYKEVLDRPNDIALNGKKVVEHEYNYASNTPHTITASVDPASNGTGSISPLGSTAVYRGRSLEYFVKGDEVQVAFQIDGQPLPLSMEPITLQDGTRVSLQYGVVVFQNVKGNHTVSAKFAL